MKIRVLFTAPKTSYYYDNSTFMPLPLLEGRGVWMEPGQQLAIVSPAKRDRKARQKEPAQKTQGS
jgi:hypothetical protein